MQIKMMTLPTTSALFMTRAVSKSFKHHYSFYQCVRKYTKKKKYDYDIDNLLDWKKKTNLVFGGSLKLTKTGKVRKSKNNENEDLKTTLEILSAQSTHLSRYRTGNELPVDNVDGPLSYIAQQEKSSNNNAPIEVIDNRVHNDDQPTNLLDTVPIDLSHDVPSQSSRDFFDKEENIPRSSRRPPYQERTKSGAGANEDDIHIPQISPIPLGDYDTPKSYNDNLELKTTKSGKRHFNTKQLPTEPPESFRFINSIPLCYSRRNLVENEKCDKMMQFKEDVKRLSLRKVPSVKSILNKTMPDLNRFFLSRWREKMIAELGEEGFKVHQEATINRGVNFHANVMELLSGKLESEIQIMPDNEGHWASLQTAMKHISGVCGLEEDMQHPALLYRGIADCVAKYKDVLCVIDWKTSKRPRPLLKNTYDDPIQVAAYIGLVSANKEILKVGEVNHGLLVIIYPDGSPAHIHLMNKSVCEQYWQDWLGRLYNYYQLVYTEKFGAGS